MPSEAVERAETELLRDVRAQIMKLRANSHVRPDLTVRPGSEAPLSRRDDPPPDASGSQSLCAVCAGYLWGEDCSLDELQRLVSLQSVLQRQCVSERIVGETLGGYDGPSEQAAAAALPPGPSVDLIEPRDPALPQFVRFPQPYARHARALASVGCQADGPAVQLGDRLLGVSSSSSSSSSSVYSPSVGSGSVVSGLISGPDSGPDSEEGEESTMGELEAWVEEGHARAAAALAAESGQSADEGPAPQSPQSPPRRKTDDDDDFDGDLASLEQLVFGKHSSLVEAGVMARSP